MSVRLVHTMQRTSPHPFADVTLLSAKLMVPPPFPLWVDKEPDKTAVSFVVRGACSKTQEMSHEHIKVHLQLATSCGYKYFN